MGNISFVILTKTNTMVFVLFNVNHPLELLAWKTRILKSTFRGKNPSQSGFVIAAIQLTNDRWENFYPEELIVFNNANMYFSSCGRKLNQPSISLSKKDLNILKVISKAIKV